MYFTCLDFNMVKIPSGYIKVEHLNVWRYEITILIMQSINKRNLIPLLKESTLADQFEDEVRNNNQY